MRCDRKNSFLAGLAPALVLALAGCGASARSAPDVPPPSPPPGEAVCGGDYRVGDVVDWAAAIDYPGDVDDFLVDPYEIPMELHVRVYGEAYGLDTVFEIIDPYGYVIDVVDDSDGRDPEGWYLLDACGPWTVRVYAFDDGTGPYDLVTEGF